MAVIKINEKYYDVGEEFADKQVVDDLIKDLQKVINTQNNIIDNLSAYEKVITNKIIGLKIEIYKIKEHKERTQFAEDYFIKQSKIEKNTKINNANINLLEMRIDNLDKFIQNFLTKKHTLRTKKEIEKFNKLFKDEVCVKKFLKEEKI
jgi:hypothetical protein